MKKTQKNAENAENASGLRSLLAAPAAKAALATLAAGCIGLAAFAVVQMGGQAFDPSAFLGGGIDRQASPEYGTAFDVDRSSTDAEANREADKNRPEDQKPSMDEVDASSIEQGGASGNKAFSVTDGSAAGDTIAGGTQGEGGSSSGDVVGPVVDGSGGGTAGGDTPGGDPDDPSAVDPDPRPALPKDFYEETIGQPASPAFPEGGIVVDPEGPSPDVQLFVLTEDDVGWMGDVEALGMERLYQGMVLDEWKLLCAAYFYVTVDGTMYRLEGYGDNFTIGAFPPVLDTDVLEVEFSFRPNAQSAWQTTTVAYRPIHYSKVLVQDWEEGTYVKQAYLDAGEPIDLGDSFGHMLPSDVTDDPFDSPVLDELFPGWSETPGGKATGASFTPAHPGRIVLHPLPLVPVSDEFRVEYSWGQQTLVGYTGTGTGVCALPEGLASVSLFGPLVADTVRIPASLLYGGGDLQARDAYEVAPGNTAFRAQDGMLIDAETGIVLGIPTRKETVVVPAGSPLVVIPENNVIRRIEIGEVALGDDPAGLFDVSLLHGADIVVPEESYVDFFAAWGSAPGDGTNRLVTDTGEVPDCVIRDGALMSSDGTVLYQVLPAQVGTYFVPAGVVTVKEGAFARAPQVEMAVLPASVAELEEESLAGDLLTRVLFEGAQPPAVAARTFGAAEAHVLPAAYDAYRDAWSAQVGADVADSVLVADGFSTSEVEGFQLLSCQKVGGGGPETLLLHAPADLVAFDADSPGARTVTSIGAQAFKDCVVLATVELPVGVTSIGAQAFADCNGLEAFHAAAPDTVSIGADAFTGCSALRFAVFEAHEGIVADWGSLYWSGFRAFVPPDATGYDDGSPSLYQRVFNTDYRDVRLAKQDGGMLLYGVDGEGGYRVLLGATTSIAGDVVLEADTVVINEKAFANCKNAFSVGMESTVALDVVGAGAFKGSGLTSIAFGQKLRWIETGSFEDCAFLESVTFAEGPDENGETEGLTRVFDAAFAGCSRLERLTFPSTLESIGVGAFTQSVGTVTLVGATPPELTTLSYGDVFVFSYDATDEILIQLAGGAQVDAYVEAWKYPLTGQDPTHQLTPEKDREGTNRARALLGLPPLETQPAAS